MEVVSTSPLRTASMIWQPRRGSFVLTVVCKATFVLAPMLAELAPEQEDPSEEENHWNDDPARSVYSPCDLVPFKPHAEVTLVGHAFAPPGERVRSLLARLVVGDVDKSVEVFAERSLAPDGTLREGAPFTRVPLRYERAAGGPETRNPVGIRSEARDAYGGQALPSLQPPGLTVTSKADFIPPVGFGPLAAGWATRQEKLGAHAGRWSSSALASAPMPEQLDPQFFMAAPPDQRLAVLHSNERIMLEHLHADHPRLVTSLPGIEPRAFVERPGAPVQELELVADTLWIDTDRSRCTLTWRGQVAIDHPAAAGRVVVGMATPARRPSWPEVEAEVRRGPPRAPPRTRTLAPADLLPDDESDTPVPARAPGEGPSRAATLPFVGASARAPVPGEGRPPALPADPAAALASAERARKRAAEDTEMTRVGELKPVAAVRSTGDASPSWLRTAAPSSPGRPAADPRMPAPPPGPLPVPAAPLPIARFEPAPAAPSFRTAVTMGAPPGAAPGSTPWTPGASAPLLEMRPRHQEEARTSPLAMPIATAPAVARPSLVSAEVVKLGAVAASNAAASAAATAPVASEAPATSAVAQTRPRDLLDLLWFEPTLPPRLRATRPFRELLELKASGGGSPGAWITGEVPARDAQAEQAARDRRDVIRVLRGIEPLGAAQMGHEIDQAFDEDGAFSAPLAVVAGELNFRFDERDALKATVTAVSPLLGADKKLRELVGEATEALKGEWPLPDDVAEGFTRRIEQAFAQTARAMPAGYLQGSVDKLLLEGRQYQKKSVFSEPRIRAELACAGASAPIPTYLPLTLAMRLPLYSRFRTVLIVELRTQEDQHETHPEALLVLALGRVVKERRSV